MLFNKFVGKNECKKKDSIVQKRDGILRFQRLAELSEFLKSNFFRELTAQLLYPEPVFAH